MVLPQFAHYLYWCFEFWVNTVAISGVLFLYDVGGVVGWLAGGREGDPEAFLFLLAGV